MDLCAIVAAIGSALAFPHVAMKLQVGGDIFLRLLRMMVVPLVVTSVMSGILGLGDVRKLGRLGGAALLYYLTTTVLAVLVGPMVVNLIQPGIGTADEASLAAIGAAGIPEAGVVTLVFSRQAAKTPSLLEPPSIPLRLGAFARDHC